MSVVYPSAKQALLKGDLDLDGTVKILAVSSTYTYAATHDFLNDVAAGARLGTAATLTGKTFTNGVFAASNLNYTGLSAGNNIVGFVGYLSTGSEPTSNLIWFSDTRSDQVLLDYTSDGTTLALTFPFAYIFQL